MSSRKSDKVSGFVNFPIGRDGWKNSKQGGMFVNLVVQQEDHDDNNCCGVENILAVFSECLTVQDEDEFKADEWGDERWVSEKYEAVQKEHFPKMWEYDYGNPKQRLKNVKRFDLTACLSTPYVAAITIGHTGWSGWNEEKKQNYMATYDDLTEEGKALWALMQKLYPKGKISLLTWLDT